MYQVWDVWGDGTYGSYVADAMDAKNAEMCFLVNFKSAHMAIMRKQCIFG